MMQAKEAAAGLRALREQAGLSKSTELQEFLAAVIDTAERFSELPVDALTAKIAALKPPAAKRGKAKAESESPPASQNIAAAIAELRDTLEDERLAVDLIDRLDRTRAITAADARAIGKAFDIHVIAKTSRKAVFDNLRALAGQLARDRYQAERIRKGA
jgi:hypothetical protein